MSDHISRVDPTSRRDFLRKGAAAAVALPAIASLGACTETETAAARTPPSAPTQPPPPAPVLSVRDKADEMDAMHEKGIKAFPAKTEGKGNQPLQPRLDKGVKVFELTAEEIQWETEPGRKVKAWAYNGQVPGPQIRVREGDRVRIRLVNKLAQSTSIHFHGLELPNDQDGVPFITQPPVKPGESYTYEFTVPNAGSHMYHSHHNSAKQVGKGLLGAFIVEPKRPLPAHRADVDYVMVLNDGAHGYTLNGKSFPATEPIVVQARADGTDPVHERRDDDPPDAPPRHAHDRHRQGWLGPAGAVEVRHPQHRAGRAVGRAREGHQSRRLGVPLPHPAARGVRTRHVRDGHGADREEGRCGLTPPERRVCRR